MSGRSPDGLVEAIGAGARHEHDEPVEQNRGCSGCSGIGDGSHRSRAAVVVRRSDPLGATPWLPGEPGTRGRSRAYAFSDYDEGWPDRFAEEADRIVAAIPEGAVAG